MPKHRHVHHHYGCDPAAINRLEVLLSAAFDALSQQVHALTTLVQGIPAKLKALIDASSGNGVSESALQGLADEVAQDVAAIQADFPPASQAAPADTTGAPTA